MKKIITLLTCALLICGSSFAQNYKQAAGVRVGVGGGAITYKHALGSSNAIDAQLTIGYGGNFGVLANYEWSTPVINNDFNLYYGVGANLGFGGGVSVGINGIVGLEYQIPGAPIALSVDYIPSFNVLFSNEVGFLPGYTNFGLGIKYTF